MVETQPNEREPTLQSLLAARARAASDARLALDTGGGLIAALLALAARPPAWPLLVSAASCFFAYGAWGIAGRAIDERPADARGVRVIRALRVSAAVLGISSVIAVGGVVMGFLLANWIH